LFSRACSDHEKEAGPYLNKAVRLCGVKVAKSFSERFFAELPRHRKTLKQTKSLTHQVRLEEDGVNTVIKYGIVWIQKKRRKRNIYNLRDVHLYMR
jgi:hypothetical protein